MSLQSPLSISHTVYKFRLNRPQAESVLDAVRSNLQRYEFEKGCSPTVISTIYFDTRDLALGRGLKKNPEENIRIRAREYFYSSSGGFVHSPYIWVEIKAKQGHAIIKKRFRLLKEYLGRVWRGVDVTKALMRNNPGAGEAALRHYRELKDILGEKEFVPTVITHYEREEYRKPTGDLRITFDRDISYHRPPEDLYKTFEVLSRDRLGRELGSEPNRILEMKDHRQIPRWLARVVDEEMEPPYSKYGDALSLLFREMSDS